MSPAFVFIFSFRFIRELAGIAVNDKCWIHNLYGLSIFLIGSIAYTGLWEITRRSLRNQLFMSIKKNIEYGLISSAIMFMSVVTTLYFIMAITFCFSCLAAPFLIAAWFYNNIVPLFC
jgi:hypothetical protein